MADECAIVLPLLMIPLRGLEAYSRPPRGGHRSDGGFQDTRMFRDLLSQPLQKHALPSLMITNKEFEIRQRYRPPPLLSS